MRCEDTEKEIITPKSKFAERNALMYSVYISIIITTIPQGTIVYIQCNTPISLENVLNERLKSTILRSQLKINPNE